jgi:hypothetical protein
MRRYRATCLGDRIVGDSNRIVFRSSDQTPHIRSSETWLIMPYLSFSNDAHALNKPELINCSDACGATARPALLESTFCCWRSASEWAKREIACRTVVDSAGGYRACSTPGLNIPDMPLSERRAWCGEKRRAHLNARELQAATPPLFSTG